MVEVASDVYDGGTDKDGDTIEALAFYLQATDVDGRRFVHDKRFNSMGRCQLDAVKEQVCNLWCKVVDAQEAGTWAGPVGNLHWVEVDPAYGSAAYSANWEEYEANRRDL